MQAAVEMKADKKTKNAELVAEYGPFEGVPQIHGVTFDGKLVWFATDGAIVAFDPEQEKIVRRHAAQADAGTAFDGTHLWQIAGDKIQKIDPASGKVLGSIPTPGQGSDSGLAWAEGALWVGEYSERKLHKVDPKTGKVLKTLTSDRFVTGVTFVDGQLWHGTIDGDTSTLRRIDQETGDVLEVREMPPRKLVSGLEADDRGRFWCGGTKSGLLRAVKR